MSTVKLGTERDKISRKKGSKALWVTAGISLLGSIVIPYPFDNAQQKCESQLVNYFRFNFFLAFSCQGAMVNTKLDF